MPEVLVAESVIGPTLVGDTAIVERVSMELSPGRTGAELELWSLRKEADYFREVFRRELFAALA